MLLSRTGNHMYLYEGGRMKSFDLRSRRDCDELQRRTKVGFDLAITNPGMFIDCNTMQIQ
ncbi:MAG: hypothetical protein WC774_02455 [Candidatus Gracilibacteria bacterium]